MHDYQHISLSIAFANSSRHGIALNLLSLIAIVMFGNIYYLQNCDVWDCLSDALVKSTYVASFKNNLDTVDLSTFLTAVKCYAMSMRTVRAC